MAIVSTIASLAGAGLSAASSVAAGQQQQAADNYNASVAKIQAGSVAAAGSAQEAQIEDQNRRKLATEANAAGDNGVEANTGSALDVMADTAAQGALDAQLVNWNTQNRTQAQLDQAGVDTWQGGIAKTAGVIKGVSTILSATASAAGKSAGGGGGGGGGSF